MTSRITETSRGANSVVGSNPGRRTMELAALVGAVEVMMSPLEWGGRDAWLGECLRRVHGACGSASAPPADVIAELEAALRLPGEEPGWLRAALASPDAERWGGALPVVMDSSQALVLVVSLRCALFSGLATLHRLCTWRSTLGLAFDDMETGMAIFGNDGLGEVARNARLDELLEEERERERLLELVACQARRAAAAPMPGVREEAEEVELVGGIYRLVTSRAAAGTLLSEAAVLVLVDRLSPSLPTTQELRATFGLRGREPQVALLAAEGLTNAAIAQRMRLSAHTVRHYLERVLERLGLHTRKALALHLMAGGAERPQPRNSR